jgi:hypothetical protein
MTVVTTQHLLCSSFNAKLKWRSDFLSHLLHSHSPTITAPVALISSFTLPLAYHHCTSRAAPTSLTPACSSSVPSKGRPQPALPTGARTVAEPCPPFRRLSLHRLHPLPMRYHCLCISHVSCLWLSVCACMCASTFLWGFCMCMFVCNYVCVCVSLWEHVCVGTHAQECVYLLADTSVDPPSAKACLACARLWRDSSDFAMVPSTACSSISPRRYGLQKKQRMSADYHAKCSAFSSGVALAQHTLR